MSSCLTLRNIEDMARDVLVNLITADRFLGGSTRREIMSRDRRFRLRNSRAKTMLDFRIGRGFDESDVIRVHEALIAGDYATTLLNRRSIFRSGVRWHIQVRAVMSDGFVQSCFTIVADAAGKWLGFFDKVRDRCELPPFELDQWRVWVLSEYFR